MANNDTPFGLKYVSNVNGRCPNIRKVYAPSTYATGLFIGEAVTFSGTANTSQITTGEASYEVGTLLEVNKTAAGDGNAITGVIVGFDQDPTNPENQYGAASTTRVMSIIDDPYAVFEIQADGIVGAASAGLNAVLIDTHSGSTVTGLAGTELDTSSDAPEANATNQLTILSSSQRPGNDTTTANSKWYVRINNHTNAHGVVGIA